MSIRIGNHSFEGPFATTESLDDKSGVYVILCKIESKYTIVDVGESATVKTRVANHDRENCWKRNCVSTLHFAVLYTPNKQQAGRKEIEKEIRNQYNPPCGER